MLPRPFKNRRALWKRLQGSAAIPGALSAAELERVFHQERARSDRSRSVFSMVVFTPSTSNTEGPELLVEVLRERMRIYDSVGLLDPQRVSIVLPETPPPGAWAFADDCIERVAESGLAYTCEVFGYPLDWQEREGELDTQPGSSSKAPGDPDSASDETRQRKALAEATGPRPEGLARVRGLHRDRPVRDLAPTFVEPLPWSKRLVDVTASGVLLLVLLPVFAIVAGLIKLTSPGPVIFTQLRAGRGGHPFRFYKFRSMYVDAEARRAALASHNEQAGPIFKMRKDPRITPIGRLLRRASIDELPQLFNVLKGDMTLIGPRPPTLDEVAQYEPWQRKRLDITGGLTCIWQVSGRSEVGFEEWVRMDLEYERRRSLGLDLKLLMRTVKAVLSGRGAY